VYLLFLLQLLLACWLLLPQLLLLGVLRKGTSSRLIIVLL
jgi:hypothetical protein